uniref:DNA topoisomerase I n=2 Tax=Sus scrofa TaxID=9823 RepID=A0A8D1CNT0_PIG
MDTEEVMGDGHTSDLKLFSVKDKLVPTRKRENPDQMKVKNPKKRNVKGPDQKSQEGRGKGQQRLKEESTFFVSKDTRSAQSAQPLKTHNHEKPSKKKGQGSSEDGALQAVPSGQDGEKALRPGTLGEGDKEPTDASQGSDRLKGKRKQTKNRGKKCAEEKQEGREEKGAGSRCRALGPREGSGDWRGAAGRGLGLGASGEAAQAGDRDTGAEGSKEDTQVAGEAATAGKAGDTEKAGGSAGRTPLQGEGEEGRGPSAVVEAKPEGGAEFIAGGKCSSETVVSRKDKKRRKGNAAGAGAPEAKELSGGDGARGREAARPGRGAPRKDVQQRQEGRRCGPETGRGVEELVGATSGGKVRKRNREASEGPETEGEGTWKWWEEERSPRGVRWTQLEHRGPCFAPPYEPLPDGVRFYYDGKPMKLSLAAEEVATFYGKMLEHEYTTKEVFRHNFFRDWRKEMTAAERKVIKRLSKCDFTEIHRHFADRAAARRALPREEKQRLKEEAEKLQQEFGYCILDGHREKIGNFKTEPPGLFRGRGDHPKMGMLKRRVLPEDVTINCGRDSKVPEPPAGHQWKEVRSDRTVTWLAAWTENVQNATKYVMLNPSSKLKGERDWEKYEVARRLKGVVDEIRSRYRADWKSREMKARQRAVALYFIDKLALRAGNEKEEGESADTVGCCSLRVEHVQLHPEADGCPYVVEFDFLGKDSIRYYNKVPVEKPVYRNLQLFLENKDPGEELFDRLTTASLNKHLQDLMDGLTAKVFRTYNASITLQGQLRALTRAEDSIAAKLLSYNRANRAVAVLCNHQRAPPKTFEKSMQALRSKIEAKKQQVAEAKAELEKARAGHASREDGSFLEKRRRRLEKLEEQLVRLGTQATDKEEGKQVALGTSKLNYLDPRISIAWCRRFGVPVEKIYNKTQREKFAWALDMAGEDFEF